MKQIIGYVALVVQDYDEALKFYVDTLGFRLIEDTFIEAQSKRWVLVAPPVLLKRDCYSHARSERKSPHASKIKLVGACFCSFRLTNSGAISMRSGARVLSSFVTPKRKATAQWQCSGTCTAICGTCFNSSNRASGSNANTPLNLRSGPRSALKLNRCGSGRAYFSPPVRPRSSGIPETKGNQEAPRNSRAVSAYTLATATKLSFSTYSPAM